MALTAKERMVRWRAKLTTRPSKHGAQQHMKATIKRKEQERYIRRRIEGKIKPVSLMTKREHRITKRRWRKHSKEYRKRKQEVDKTITPPNTSGDNSPDSVENSRSNPMKRSMNRKRFRGKATCYRQNQTLRMKLASQMRLDERYKKRFNRLKKIVTAASPTQTWKLNRVISGKAYLLYKSMVDNIRHHYKTTKSNSEKRMISKLIVRKRILRKYKLSTFIQSTLSFSRRHLDQRPLRKPRIGKLKLKGNVNELYERDDVSRIKADKKATITRKGVKMQVLLLTDDMKTLHAKYTSEGKNVSYSLFCRLRPFWVIKPRGKDRQTCLCKIHDNLRLILNAAVNANMVDTIDVDKLIKQVVCDDTRHTK